MLGYERKVGDKLMVQKSFPEEHVTIYRFSTEKQGIFQVVQKDESYIITQLKELPQPPSTPPFSRNASSFYCDYLLFLARQGFDAVSLQRITLENFGWEMSSCPSIHCLHEDAVRKLLARNSIRPLQYCHDQFDSLRYFMGVLENLNTQAEPPQQNFLLMVENESGFIWAYSPWQLRQFALEAPAFHLDATYKLLQCRKGIFAIVVRAPSGRGLPVCYFIVEKEDSDSLAFVLRAFCDWVGQCPPAWIHDCQASIIHAIEEVFPQSADFLCVFHAIRAWDRQLQDKCIDKDAKNAVTDILYEIAMHIDDPGDADVAIEAIKETLSNEEVAFRYLESTWFSRLHKWAFFERGELDRTNNLEESHFHSLKTAHLLNKTQWRIDTLVVKLVTQVMKDFFVREARELEILVDITSFGVDLDSIPDPDEEQNTQIQMVNHLCQAIQKRSHESGCDLQLLIKHLGDILEEI
jgi:hypothetical protein